MRAAGRLDRAAGRAQSDLIVIMVVVARPPPTMASTRHPATGLICNSRPSRRSGPGWAARARLYTMTNRAVHAKFVMLDDGWMTIGSANPTRAALRARFELKRLHRRRRPRGRLPPASVGIQPRRAGGHGRAGPWRTSFLSGTRWPRQRRQSARADAGRGHRGLRSSDQSGVRPPAFRRPRPSGRRGPGHVFAGRSPRRSGRSDWYTATVWGEVCRGPVARERAVRHRRPALSQRWFRRPSACSATASSGATAPSTACPADLVLPPGADREWRLRIEPSHGRLDMLVGGAAPARIEVLDVAEA